MDLRVLGLYFGSTKDPCGQRFLRELREETLECKICEAVRQYLVFNVFSREHVRAFLQQSIEDMGYETDDPPIFNMFYQIEMPTVYVNALNEGKPIVLPKYRIERNSPIERRSLPVGEPEDYCVKEVETSRNFQDERCFFSLGMALTYRDMYFLDEYRMYQAGDFVCEIDGPGGRAFSAFAFARVANEQFDSLVADLDRLATEGTCPGMYYKDLHDCKRIGLARTNLRSLLSEESVNDAYRALKDAFLSILCKMRHRCNNVVIRFAQDGPRYSACQHKALCGFYTRSPRCLVCQKENVKKFLENEAAKLNR